MRCGLTTPPFMQVLPIKRLNSCGIRARYCDALCAAMMTQFLLQLGAHFGSVFRQLGEIVRAQVAQGGAAIRAGCAHSSGSVWAMNVPGYRSSGAALCLCADPPASVWTSVANCYYLRAGCCRTVRMGWCKTSGKVKPV